VHIFDNSLVKNCNDVEVNLSLRVSFFFCGLRVLYYFTWIIVVDYAH
jgi:hypothetical protein